MTWIHASMSWMTRPHAPKRAGRGVRGHDPAAVDVAARQQARATSGYDSTSSLIRRALPPNLWKFSRDLASVLNDYCYSTS